MEQRTPAGQARGHGWRWLAALAAAGVVATACTQGGRTDYGKDGDTGQAAPATVPDQSTADMLGTDSTTGMGGRTGRPGMAGDTLSQRGNPAGPPPQTTPPARPPQ